MPSPPLSVPTPLVDIHWLHTHRHDPTLTVIDCRFALGDPQAGRQAYQAGHIPGAFYLDLNQDLSSPVQRHGGRHPLPAIEALAAKLTALGITSQPATPVVAYDASQGAFASRLWWLLRYLGHEEIAVLDGGWPAWQAAGYPVEQAVPTPPQNGNFSPQVQADWVVDRAEAEQRREDSATVLVDARSPERYRGEQEPIDPIAGAIPGAVNFFWQDNLDEQGQFLSPAALRSRWQALALGPQPIFYCGSGVTACVNLLAQAVLGNPLPQLYVGGWSDWCSYPLAPAPAADGDR